MSRQSRTSQLDQVREERDSNGLWGSEQKLRAEEAEDRADKLQARVEELVGELKRRIKAAEDREKAEPSDYPGQVFKSYARAEAEALKGVLRLLEPIPPEDLERASQLVRDRGWDQLAGVGGGNAVESAPNAAASGPSSHSGENLKTSPPNGEESTHSDPCPTCGSPVEVISSDEGTSYFKPVTDGGDGR